MYSTYFTAELDRKMMWFVTGALRNEAGWAFDRTLDAKRNLIEFLVAPNYEEEFVKFMRYFEKLGYVQNLQKLPNRYKELVP